jgi:hypothetical protein
MNSVFPQERMLRTTLRELIYAISDEVGPGEEVLISAAVLDLIQSSKVKWARALKISRSINFDS